MYVKYTEYRTGGEVCEGQEGESYPNFEDEYCYINITGVVKNQPSQGEYDRADDHTDNIEIGKLAYVVVVKYTTGCTFGCSHGHLAIPAIFDSREKAEEIMKQILDKRYEGYKPWSGYFEYLESCDVESFIVT